MLHYFVCELLILLPDVKTYIMIILKSKHISGVLLKIELICFIEFYLYICKIVSDVMDELQETLTVRGKVVYNK